MDLNITGDPGTHNTYNEVNIHINHVDNFNPNASTVINHYGSQPRDASTPDAPITSNAPTTESHSSESPTSESSLLRLYRNPSPSTSSPSPALIDRQRDDILAYIQRLTRVVAAPYVLTYELLWRDILSTDEVAAEVYTPGKQQGTTFNRNLVAAIIGMMKKSGLFGDITDTRLAELLEGDKDHSVRNALAATPSRVIYNNVRTRIETLTAPAK